MKNATKMMVITFVIVFAAINSDAKDYSGIVPLKSTRADVERKFGLPENGKPYNGRAIYRFEDKRITFRYLDSPCNTRENCWCFVPVDTVIDISVVFEESKSFSELHIDTSKFKRKTGTDSTTVPRSTYYNEEEGIIYYVDDSDDEILEINYIPSKKDCDEVLSKINHY